MKSILIVLMFVAFSFSVDMNYNGYGDTSLISNFKADSLKYGKIRTLSQYENVVIDVWVNDTSSAGYASDSIGFYWGYQTGHPFRDGSGTICTLWTRPRVMVDSFVMSSAIKKDTFTIADSNYTYYTFYNVVDTSKTDFARQSKLIVPQWDVFYRTWFKGKASNKKIRFLSIRDIAYRRLASKADRP